MSPVPLLLTHRKLDMTDSMQPATQCLHAGQVPDPTTNSRAVPIYQTTSYVFNDTDHAASLFGLQEFGNIYTRIMNPTCDVLEKRLAALEGGFGALAVASGQAAESLAILNITPGRAEHRLVDQPLRRDVQPVPLHVPQVRHHVKFVDQSRSRRTSARRSTTRPAASSWRRSATRACDVPDFEAICKIAHDAGIPRDRRQHAGLAGPVPAVRAWRADVVVHSCTKFIGGHGTSIGGVIVEKGDFPWGNGKFPELTEPDPSYHGMKFFETFGPMNIAYILKARTQLLRDLGPAMSPVQCVPVPAGTGDAAPADGAPQRERAGRRPVPADASQGARGSITPASKTHPVVQARQEVPARTAAGRSSASASRERRRRSRRRTASS